MKQTCKRCGSEAAIHNRVSQVGDTKLCVKCLRQFHDSCNLLEETLKETRHTVRMQFQKLFGIIKQS